MLVNKFNRLRCADPDGLRMLGIHTLFHRCQHLLEGFGKQIFGILDLKHTELRHAGTDNGNPPVEFSTFFHFSSRIDTFSNN